MISEYQEQALNFVLKHNIIINKKYIGLAKHFTDDKVERDTWKIEIINWKTRETMIVKYGQSLANTGKQVPSDYDILTCLTKHDVGSFDNFIGDYGYKIDTRKEYLIAQKTYKACCKEWKGVARVFSGSEMLEELREIN